MSRDWFRHSATIILMVSAALAAYYTTVYGIRLTVNEKADRLTVEQIDRRLTAIETLLRTHIAHQSDIIEMRSALDNRLTRIEALLENR